MFFRCGCKSGVTFEIYRLMKLQEKYVTFLIFDKPWHGVRYGFTENWRNSARVTKNNPL